ncbi:FAD-binding protein [Rhodococcus sp. NCIMB 12038]|uniref:FAD-binding protein n=1 Tax=Rhodococcus sp. NCIMB 12038 TaxID=933800 RepID=UPI000B3CB809|nr:FAD-binding protein [Rhodococcus sp. NCIMB 12038]OUS94701.1 3-ketosteroid-delta-1-dehydrogenase [Rhodococcus sp. NCIMB 12038]
MSVDEQNWDREVDLLVIGSGAGGMTAALAGAERGLDTLVVEKSGVYGGSTALSGGALWIPNSPILVREGRADDPADVRKYLESIVGDSVPGERLDAYIEQGPAMMRFFEQHCPHLRFSWCEDYSDYHPENVGGRSKGRTVEPLPFDMNQLGADGEQQRPNSLAMPGGLYMTSTEFRHLNMFFRTWAGRRTALGVGWRSVVAMVRRRRMETLGQALVGRLRLSLQEAGVPLWLNSPLKRLITDESGAVTGAVVESGERELRIRARRGVMMATGGFEQSEEMRKRYLREGGKDNYSAGSPDNTGDGIVAGEQVGAAVDLMDDAWWMPSFRRPDGIMHVLVSERSIPPSLIVDQNGKRFTNEASPYVSFVHDQIAGGHDPVWFVFDSKAKSRYQFGGVMPGQKFPAEWFSTGLMLRAETLGELAQKMSVPADALSAEITRFNGFARAGVDADFGRGDSAYDRYYGDPGLPNPTLDEVDKAPYYAVRMEAGDLGTKGGLVCNEHSQVLTGSGEPIPGLYATGNTSASVMGNDYAGAGATIGPAMVFGWVGARHAAATAEAVS